MRKMGLCATLLLLCMTAAAPAQFTINGARITNGANTNAAATAVPTVGLTQMIPRMNGTQMLASPLGSPGSFSFAKMIPNFSWMRNRLWPIATPRAQLPAGYGQSMNVR